MAIYHLHVNYGSKSSGKSAKAKFNYICREGKYRNGRDDLVYRQYGNMPSWIDSKPVNYWEAADTFERSNGRLFKEVEIALPVELEPQEQVELCQEFAHHLTREERLPYVFAIHDEDGVNPHCHIMISERANDAIDRTKNTWFKRANSKSPELGGAKKTTSLMPKDWLLQTREKWAEIGNNALERVGVARELDHRTLEAQGINRAPGVHLGPKVYQMEVDGIRCDRVTEFLERQELVKKGNLILDEIYRWEYDRNRVQDIVERIKNKQREDTLSPQPGDMPLQKSIYHQLAEATGTTLSEPEISPTVKMEMDVIRSMMGLPEEMEPTDPLLVDHKHVRKHNLEVIELEKGILREAQERERKRERERQMQRERELEKVKKKERELKKQLRNVQKELKERGFKEKQRENERGFGGLGL